MQRYIQTDMSEKVAVVISADLAHTHLKTGPYGYSNASEPFDLVRVISYHHIRCVPIREVSSFQRVLRSEDVSLLERCPHFRGVGT